MRIERDIIKTFKQWKDDPDRKPILHKGARQIGKTWAMETFGKECLFLPAVDTLSDNDKGECYLTIIFLP